MGLYIIFLICVWSLIPSTGAKNVLFKKTTPVIKYLKCKNEFFFKIIFEYLEVMYSKINYFVPLASGLLDFVLPFLTLLSSCTSLDSEDG